MGIVALILSIVGTIVGVIVFMSVVSTSFDNAFGRGDTKVVQPSGDAGKAAGEKPAAKAGTRENPSPIGSVIESDDWRVVINSVTLAATDAVLGANQFNDPPAAGSEYILVIYPTTYIGDDANGQMPASCQSSTSRQRARPSILLSSSQSPSTRRARSIQEAPQQEIRPLKCQPLRLAKGS